MTKIKYTFGGNCRTHGYIRVLSFVSDNVGAAYTMASNKLENARLISFGT